MGQKVMIHNARGSFLDVGEPKKFSENDPADRARWSATALITPGETTAQRCDPNGTPVGPKEDAKTLIDKILGELALEKWGAKNGPIHLANIRQDTKACCFVDGNRKTYDGYQGRWALTAHRYIKDGRPLVLDTGGKEDQIYDVDGNLRPGKGGRLYSGCFINFQCEIYPSENKGNGLRGGLLGIQRTKDGDAFGGASRPTGDAFGSIEEGVDDEALG